MFWGLNLKPNRKYSQTTTKAFHISHASLDVETSQGGPNQVFILCENQKFLICTLNKASCTQSMLDLNFAEGEEICFQTVGSGNISLSGYLIDDESMNFMDGEEEEEESEAEDMPEDLRNALNKKAKANAKKSAGKSAGAAKANAAEADEDEEDEDDSDLNETALDGEDAEDSDEDDDDEEEEDDEEEDDSDEEDEEVQQPKAKQPKLEKPQKQQNGVPAKETAPADKKGKKNKDKKQEQQQQKPVGVERTIAGGVKIEDLRMGTGAEAKVGKRAQVYYEGRFKNNNKVFDSLKNGSGFKFGVGRGEVIKGWDVGVVGMKVGGKRRIICPPHMAYGARGSPPAIPPNSTLVFEVELKALN